jgi:hypothetical protein
MTWRYEQSTGRLWHLEGTGYSGYDPDPTTHGEPGEGKNDPADEAVRSVGPIPNGHYQISPAFKHPTTGDVTMRLTPAAGTDTHGRSGLLIHGDSRSKPGQGSHGCIVLPRVLRERIAMSGDRDLVVVPGDNDA